MLGIYSNTFAPVMLLQGFAFPLLITLCADQSSNLEGMKKAGFWASVSDHLVMFPLSQPVRAVLLEMLCVGTKPHQVAASLQVLIVLMQMVVRDCPC